MIICCKIHSGEAVCTTGFPDVIIMENSTAMLDTIPEGTEVLVPSLKITCDGYISYVSVGYKARESIFNQSVYLQLWRSAAAMNIIKYLLVEEVMVPAGESWPGNNSHNILNHYKLPSKIKVQSNDIIGFRTPMNSSVKVLVDTTDQREIIENGQYMLNVSHGVPQIMITNSMFININLTFVVLLTCYT